MTIIINDESKSILNSIQKYSGYVLFSPPNIVTVMSLDETVSVRCFIATHIENSFTLVDNFETFVKCLKQNYSVTVEKDEIKAVYRSKVQRFAFASDVVLHERKSHIDEIYDYYADVKSDYSLSRKNVLKIDVESSVIEYPQIDVNYSVDRTCEVTARDAYSDYKLVNFSFPVDDKIISRSIEVDRFRRLPLSKYEVSFDECAIKFVDQELDTTYLFGVHC